MNSFEFKNVDNLVFNEFKYIIKRENMCKK